MGAEKIAESGGGLALLLDVLRIKRFHLIWLSTIGS